MALQSAELVCVDPSGFANSGRMPARCCKTACYRTGLNAFADIEADILSGRSLLWIAWNGHTVESAAADRPDPFRDRQGLHHHCLRRQRHEALAAADRPDRILRKAEGCRRVRIFGRKGWLRVLAGFEEKHVIMDKDLG